MEIKKKSKRIPRLTILSHFTERSDGHIWTLTENRFSCEARG